MLSIKLSDLNRSHYGPLYVGNTQRLATATSIRFIDSSHLCVSHLVGMYIQLYMFDFNTKSFKLLDQIDTTYNGKTCITDLMDRKENLLVTSNFDLGTQTFYKIENNKLTFYKELPDFFYGKQRCHGIKFYNDDIICFTLNSKFSVMFVDYNRKEVLYQFDYLPNYNPKDIAFTSDYKMIIVYSTSNITPLISENKRKSTIVYLEFNVKDKTHTILDEYDIHNHHADSITFKKGVIFLGNQIEDTIDTLSLNNRISHIETINGFNKPHGVDVYDDFLGVSNYGDNTIKVIKIPPKTLSFMKA